MLIIFKLFIQWCIVSLSLPLKTLRSVCWQAVVEMRKSGRSVAALPVAASVVVRLAALLKTGKASMDASYLPPPLAPQSAAGASSTAWIGEPSAAAGHHHHQQHGSSAAAASAQWLNPMMSEAVRRETFAGWPHMNYRWALPGPMAEAGFYHQPNTPESDRAVCFQCFLTLIAWESTDDPWSEHERHAPTCPLVKGDYTCNVPLSVTLATQPAVVAHRDAEPVSLLSASTCPDLLATATATGSVTLWSISGPLKKEVSFEAAAASVDAGPSKTSAADSLNRLTSLCVLVSSSPASTPKCSVVAGLTIQEEQQQQGRPCLAVYDVAWKPTLCEPHPVTSATGSAPPAPAVKKGGTTKKVLPVPHILTAG